MKLENKQIIDINLEDLLSEIKNKEEKDGINIEDIFVNIKEY